MSKITANYNYISHLAPSRTSYAPVSIFDDLDSMSFKILPTDVEIQSIEGIRSGIELLNIPEVLYPDELEDTESPLLDLHLQNKLITFTSFFAHQRIDIPLCFKRTVSLYRDHSFELTSRLINIISKHGRKPYVSSLYSKAVLLLIRKAKKGNLAHNPLKYSSWNTLLSALTTYSPTFDNGKGSLIRAFDSTLPNLNNESYSRQLFNTSNVGQTDTIISSSLEPYLPAFSFFVRKVDKLKRKHSRGKTGKHEIIWKYVPEYKRYWTVIRWLCRDIKFQKVRTLRARVDASFDILLFNHTSHLVFKLRQFVHKFVFNNHKKTLLRTLRSVS